MEALLHVTVVYEGIKGHHLLCLLCKVGVYIPTISMLQKIPLCLILIGALFLKCNLVYVCSWSVGFTLYVFIAEVIFLN
jgi:hypothetical protein